MALNFKVTKEQESNPKLAIHYSAKQILFSRIQQHLF
jgi:hypothetical protein